MSDGPFCFRINQLQDTKRQQKTGTLYDMKIINKHNDTKQKFNALKAKSVDTGPMKNVGLLVAENQYSFTLSFVSYNNATQGGHEMLVDRVVDADFGLDRKIVIEFDSPVVVSQKYEEDMIKLENLADQVEARKAEFPTGPYGYSQIVPVVIKFPKPVQFSFVYMKQHRSAAYFEKKTIGQHIVRGWYKNELVFDSKVTLLSWIWKQILPAQPVIIDRLEIPPFADFDSLHVTVDSAEGFYLSQQRAKKAVVPLLERTYFTPEMMEEQKKQQNAQNPQNILNLKDAHFKDTANKQNNIPGNQIPEQINNPTTPQQGATQSGQQNNFPGDAQNNNIIQQQIRKLTEHLTSTISAMGFKINESALNEMIGASVQMMEAKEKGDLAQYKKLKQKIKNLFIDIMLEGLSLKERERMRPQFDKMAEEFVIQLEKIHSDLFSKHSKNTNKNNDDQQKQLEIILEKYRTALQNNNQQLANTLALQFKDLYLKIKSTDQYLSKFKTVSEKQDYLDKQEQQAQQFLDLEKQIITEGDDKINQQEMMELIQETLGDYITKEEADQMVKLTKLGDEIVDAKEQGDMRTVELKKQEYKKMFMDMYLKQDDMDAMTPSEKKKYIEEVEQMGDMMIKVLEKGPDDADVGKIADLLGLDEIYEDEIQLF